MTMNRCATCKHWDREMDVLDEMETTRVCHLIRPDGACDKAMTNDSADLFTRFDFGCTEHEPKEDTAP